MLYRAKSSDNDIIIDASTIEKSLLVAKEFFGEQWLQSEYNKEPSDLFFSYRAPNRSLRQISQVLREGKSGAMHPLAEAVLMGEEAMRYYHQCGKNIGRESLYRLCSLRAVLSSTNAIQGIENRLIRLKGEQWKSALYELLTAAAYTTLARVSLIEEGISPVPDMKVEISPPIFVECKAKLQAEDAVVRFISHCKKEALGPIQQYLVTVDSGFLIQIEINDKTAVQKLPGAVQKMIAKGILRKEILGASISIKPFKSGPYTFPEPMPFHSAELWNWLFGFTEWDDWHIFMPGGLFEMMKDIPFAIVTGVKQPILVCVRHSTLANSSQNIRSTLKDTCRRQFRKNSPGIIHVLVNTRYYGIGFRAQQSRIIDDLEATAVSVLKEYTRLLAIVFDIVTPPPPGSTVIQHRRLVCPHSERAANIVSKLLSIESAVII